MIEGLLNLGGHQLLSLGVWTLFNDFLIYYEKLVWCFFSSRTKTAIKFPKVQLIFDHRRDIQLTHDLIALSISYWSIAQEPGTQEDPISSTSSGKCRLRGISIVGHSFLVQPYKKVDTKEKHVILVSMPQCEMVGQPSTILNEIQLRSQLLQNKTLPKVHGPEGSVQLNKVGQITSSYTNLDQSLCSESRPSTNFKISTKHQHFDKT